MRSDAKAQVRDDAGNLETLLAQKTRELLASEARFRTLFEGIPETVLVHDVGGEILLANDFGAAALERRPQDLEGTNLIDLIPPGEAEKVLAATRAAAIDGASSFEASFVTPSGRRLVAAANCRAIELDGRIAVLSVARDMTEQRDADRARAEFMAIVAHDIRNPLSVVLGYAEMLREMGGFDSEREAMIARLAANARWVISLVSNYLDLSRIEADRLVLHSGKVELNLVLQQVGELYEDEARRKQIRFELCLDGGLPRIPGDATALERVFGNLLHNALKYTPACGCITLRSGRDGAGVVASVVDTGAGIPADEVSSIFDRYRRPLSGRAKHGSGLGLFIARALVEAHGGTIDVATRPGAGSSFTVRLPG